MRNRHYINEKVELQCPKCGCDFTHKVIVEYSTNEHGDVIGYKIK